VVTSNPDGVSGSPEPLGNLADQFRPGDGRGVDAHLVRSGAQQPVHVVDRPDPPADGERDEHLLRGAAHHVVHGLPVAAGRGDVQEHQLVGSLGVVHPGHLDRVAGIPQVAEVHALDHPPRVHVEARDHPDGDGHVPAPR
jgi:hypothetical protein